MNDYPDKWDKLKDMDQQIRDKNPDRVFKLDYTLQELEDRFKK